MFYPRFYNLDFLQSFGWNLLGAVIIMAWTAACCTLMFGSMKLLGVLRVPRDVEIAGLDTIKHGEPAYPLKGYRDGEHPHTIPSCRKFAVALNLP